MKKSIKILSTVLALTVLMTSFAALTAYGDENEKNGSAPSEYNILKIWYKADDYVLTDKDISVYHIADISAQGDFSYTEDFIACNIEVDELYSRDSFDSVTSALSSYISLNSVAPFETAPLNNEGCAVFEDLTRGVYFVDGFSVKKDSLAYSFGCVLFNSFFTEEKADSSEEINIYPKHQTYSASDEEYRCKVTKLWKDNGKESSRPQSIEVVIFKNGEEDQRVVLSDENNWTYYWTSSDSGAVWNVAEVNAPSAYRSEVTLSGYNFNIINSVINSDTPDTPTSSGPTDSSKADNTSKPVSPVSNTNGGSAFSQAVKTGFITNVYFWILLLTVSGTAFILLSVAGRRKETEE